MNTTQSRAEVYLMALQSLSKAEKKEVVTRLLEDEALWEDILDIALIRQREGEQGRPYEDYRTERNGKSRKV